MLALGMPCCCCRCCCCALPGLGDDGVEEEQQQLRVGLALGLAGGAELSLSRREPERKLDERKATDRDESQVEVCKLQVASCNLGLDWIPIASLVPSATSTTTHATHAKMTEEHQHRSPERCVCACACVAQCSTDVVLINLSHPPARTAPSTISLPSPLTPTPTHERRTVLPRHPPPALAPVPVETLRILLPPRALHPQQQRNRERRLCGTTTLNVSR